MKTLFLFACVTIAALAACSSSSPSDSGDASSIQSCPVVPTSSTCQDPQAPPSYAKDVAPVIKSVCAPCHYPGGVAVKAFPAYDFSVYDNVVNAGTAILNELALCNMPPIHGYSQFGIAPGSVPGISTADATTMAQWIHCGTPDN
jgi:hypothetical protein